MNTGEFLPLKRIFTNAGYLLSGKGVSALTGFACTALASRTLGLHSFGILLLIHAFAMTASSLSRLQSWQPLLHYGNSALKSGDSALLHRLLRFCTMQDILGALVGMLIGGVGIFYFSTAIGCPPSVRFSALLYISSIFFMNTNCSLGILRLTGNFRLVMAGNVVRNVVQLGGVIAGFVMHWSLNGFLMVWYMTTVATFVVNTTLSWGTLLRMSVLKGFSPFGSYWDVRIPGIWRFSLSTSLNQILNSLSTRISFLLVGALLGPSDASIFRVTSQICDGLAQPGQLLAPALYPELIQLRDQGDYASMRRLLIKLLQIIGAFAVVVLLITAFFGQWALQLMLNTNWHESNLVLLFIMGSAILNLLGVPLEPALISRGQANKVVLRRLCVTLFLLPLLYIMTLHWGLLGVASATLLGAFAIFLTRAIPTFSKNTFLY